MEALKNLITNKVPSVSSATGCKRQSHIDIMNDIEGNLKGYDCDKCRNKGVIYYEKDGYEYFRECGCMKVRQSISRIERSGLKSILGKYTFDNYETSEPFQRHIKTKASNFVSDCKGNWFYLTAANGYSFGEEPLRISITAFFKKAKSNKNIYTTKKPDVDNIAKIVLDGLNVVAYNDDSQVIYISAAKVYGDEYDNAPCIYIEVENGRGI